MVEITGELINKVNTLHDILGSWERVAFEMGSDITTIKKVLNKNNIKKPTLLKINDTYERVAIKGIILYGKSNKIKRHRNFHA